MESVVPEIDILVQRAGQAEIAPGARQFEFVPSTSFPELFPLGRGGRVGGFQTSIETTRQPTIRLIPRQGLTSPRVGRGTRIESSAFDSSIFGPSRFRPSSFAPSSFGPSGISPSRIAPSAFGSPSRFSALPPTPTTGGPPSPPSRFNPFGPGITVPTISPPTSPVIIPFGARDEFSPVPRRRDPSKRKVKGKKVTKRRRPTFPISVSFTAVAADLFGPFPTARVSGLGLLPGQTRFQPISRAPRRPSLGGVRTRRTRKKRKK